MAKQDILEKLNFEVKANKDHAQILLEINDSKLLNKAKKIIEDLGISIIESKKLSANLVLLKLNISDMRVVALKLTENGFLEIKGYNASCF